MEQLQAALTKSEASLKDRVTDHEKSTNLLNSQLQEALTERDTAKSELRKHEEAVQSTSNTQQEHLYAQIQVLLRLCVYVRVRACACARARVSARVCSLVVMSVLLYCIWYQSISTLR